MKRFLKLYLIEQKLALRSGDMLLFGVAMPVGVMILINMIAGQKEIYYSRYLQENQRLGG